MSVERKQNLFFVIPAPVHLSGHIFLKDSVKKNLKIQYGVFKQRGKATIPTEAGRHEGSGASGSVSHVPRFGWNTGPLHSNATTPKGAVEAVVGLRWQCLKELSSEPSGKISVDGRGFY